MITDNMNQQVIHPLARLQRQVRSLVERNLLKPSDSIWKIALLYGNDWAFLKQELLDYEFTMQDPVSELMLVERWDDEE